MPDDARRTGRHDRTRVTTGREHDYEAEEARRAAPDGARAIEKCCTAMMASHGAQPITFVGYKLIVVVVLIHTVIVTLLGMEKRERAFSRGY